MVRTTVIIICAILWVGCGTTAKTPAPMKQAAAEAKNQPVVPCELALDNEEAQPQMQTLFPEKIGDTEWKQVDKIRLFDTRTLFKHIDGAAEAFFAYGFELCGVAEYVRSDGADEASAEDEFILADIYHMGRPIQAFGMYTSELYSESEFVDIGAQGYVEPPTLNFWKGPYYVKIAAVSNDENTGEINMELARQIAHRIPGKAEKPSMLSLLPQEGLVKGTENYALSNILGYGFLKNGVMADYQVDGEEKSLLIMELDSDGEAMELLARFISHEEKSGEGLAKITDLGEDGFIAKDKYYKRLIVVRQGKYVALIRPVIDELIARKLIKMVVENINLPS